MLKHKSNVKIKTQVLQLAMNTLYLELRQHAIVGQGQVNP